MPPPVDPVISPTAARPGMTLAGRYRLESLLGQGGMGEVWRARDAQLERDVAVKLPTLGMLDTAGRAQLLREARVAASLSHPGIVAVHDAGETGGQPFIVMELVEGRSLRERPSRDPVVVRMIARQVLEALEHVHAQGIVHRDLKPENLLVTGPESAPRVRVADLGVARLESSTTLTRADTIVGTAAYLSPEQALGGAIDGRADLYALGAVLYELVAGRPPFEGPDALAVISQHLHAPVPPPRTHRPDVEPGLERFVMRLLAKSPDDRYPSAREALQALDAMAAGAAPSEEAPAESTLLDQLVRGRLVGRGAELERLRDVWRSTLQGRAQLALVSGEPGVGKSRLAREMVVAARVDGAVVLAGGCYEFEATTPYLPFVEAIAAWARGRDDAALREALGGTAPEIARLVPGIDSRLGPFAAPPALAPHEERIRLFDAVARLLRSLAARRGLLVFLDDVHWADTGTLALMRYLLRQLRDERVLLLATYREIELDRQHPLAAALVEWNRDRIATRVALGRLGRADSDGLLATLLGQDEVSPEFGEAMHRETEGNPFFLEEVVKALIEQGQIYREGGEWQRRDVADLAIPQSVKAAIGRRLDRLGPECVETLHLAAVLGKTFAFADLASCSTRNEDELLDALDEATAAQLVIAREGESFTFTHDKIREVLYEELNPVRRRRTHQKIGEMLEARADARVEDLSFHFLHAGDLERALRWSLAAAERSRHVQALDEAVVYLARAVECADAIGDRARLLDVVRALASLQSERGDGTATIAACRRALPLCTSAAERAAVNTLAGEICVRNGNPLARDFLEAAQKELDPATQQREIALVKTNFARLHHYRAEHTRAIAMLEETLAMPVVKEDPQLAALVYSYFAGSYQHLVDYPASMEWADRCVELGRRVGQPTIEAIGHEFLCEDLNAIGRWRDALPHAEEDLRIGRRSGSLDRQAWATWAKGWCLLGLGELEPGIELAMTSLQLCEQMGEIRLPCLVTGLFAWAFSETGRDEEADRLVAEAVERSASLGQVVMMGEVHRGRAFLALARGDGAAALAAAREAFRVKAGTENVLSFDVFNAVGALGALLAGELETAETMARECLAFSDAKQLESARGMAHRALAGVAAARGRIDEALAGFEIAIAVDERTESRVEVARTLAERADVLRAAGRADEANADRQRALALAGDCGMVRLAARLRAS